MEQNEIGTGEYGARRTTWIRFCREMLGHGHEATRIFGILGRALRARLCPRHVCSYAESGAKTDILALRIRATSRHLGGSVVRARTHKRVVRRQPL